MVRLRVHQGPLEFSNQSPHMWCCCVAWFDCGFTKARVSSVIRARTCGLAVLQEWLPGVPTCTVYVHKIVCKDGFTDEDPLGRHLELELFQSLPMRM